MKRDPAQRMPRGAIADLWRHTLSRIPTVFGRLTYLASLRNGNNGRYEHHGLAAVSGEDEAHQALFDSHVDSFREWLGFRLEQQRNDLDAYLGPIPDRPALIRSWLLLSTYMNFIPEGINSAERELYLADLRTLLDLFRNEYGVAVPDPDA